MNTGQDHRAITPSSTANPNHNVKAFCLISLFILGGALDIYAQRSSFYDALHHGNLEALNNQLTYTAKVKDNNLRNGYEGAVCCRIAGMESTPLKKLETFKKGAGLLEEAIKQEPEKAELRFLRLIIQEHAPGILGYNENIKDDCLHIRQEYPHMDAELKVIVKDYDLNSENLSL